MNGLRMGWLGAIVSVVTGTAAGAESLADGVRRCAREVDEHQRLACFDALAGALPTIKSDQFGMTADIAQKRNPEAPFDPGKSEVLAGMLARAQEVTNGQWIFTLDNGQIWIQAEPKAGLKFNEGEAVQIEHGAMGSLWLTADRHRKARVKRVR